MARPIKEGLDYYSMDVDFYDDPKILYAEETHGILGGYIASRLLCLIYREGYFIKWDDDMSLVFSKRIGNGITHVQVKSVVSTLLEKGFFEKGLFNEFGILSSHGIQKRWLRIISDCKRKAGINSVFDLVSSRIIEFPPEETTPKQELSTQSKVKESKEKKNNPIPLSGAVSQNHSKSPQTETIDFSVNDANTPEIDLEVSNFSDRVVDECWGQKGVNGRKEVVGIEDSTSGVQGHFELFWEAYGKKIDRSKCERKFNNLSKAERAAILAHVPEYVASTPNVQYRKNPFTYLNGKCWLDEHLPAGENTANNPGQRNTGGGGSKYEMVY